LPSSLIKILGWIFKTDTLIILCINYYYSYYALSNYLNQFLIYLYYYCSLLTRFLNLKKIQKKIIDLLPILQIFQELAHLHSYINEKSRENNFIKNLPSYKIGKNLQKKKELVNLFLSLCWPINIHTNIWCSHIFLNIIVAGSHIYIIQNNSLASFFCASYLQENLISCIFLLLFLII